MAHSKIIQITKEKTDDRICEEDFYQGKYSFFVGQIADYTDDMDEDSWPSVYDGCLNGNGLEIFQNEEGDWKLRVVDRDAWFKKDYRTFVENAKLCTEMPFDDFTRHKNAIPVYMVHAAYEDEFGVYVCDMGEWAGLDTLQSFMRRANNGDEYYLGAVVDYHF